MLGHHEFDELIAAGCPACRGQFLRAWAMLPGSIEISGGEPVSSVRWGYERDDIHDLVYRVECRDCNAVVYEHHNCPKCGAPGARARAVEHKQGLSPPASCPLCEYEDLRASAQIRAYHEFLHGRFSRRVCAAELHEPGFQVHKVDCKSCEQTVATAGHGCIACGRSSLLKKLR
jgi:hypothetical protein